MGSASNAKLQVKFSLDTGRDLIHQVDIAPLVRPESAVLDSAPDPPRCAQGDLIACSVGDSCQLFSLSKHSFRCARRGHAGADERAADARLR